MWQNACLRSVGVASTAILLMLAGCRRSDVPQDTGTASEPARPAAQSPNQRTIGVSLWTTEEPRQAQLKADIEAAAAKHPELRLEVRDAQRDVGQQVSDVEAFLAERVNLIIISPISAQALAEPLAKAFSGGIAVIVLDRPVVGDQYTCRIEPDIRQLGTEAGTWLAAKLGGKGKIIAIQGPADSLSDQDQYTAFRAALRDPGYRFIYEGHVDPPRIDAAQIMREALQHTQQVDAVYAYTDEAAKAAYETAHAAGREKGVFFVGVGGLPADGQAWVSQGILDASVLCPTGGSEAVKTAVKLLAGQKVPKTIVPGGRVFTKAGSWQPSAGGK
jgi:ribose transport system substrate-binding protein